jgi:hypothetical protein
MTNHQQKQLEKAGQPISDVLLKSKLQQANFAGSMYCSNANILTPFGQRVLCAIFAVLIAISLWLVVKYSPEPGSVPGECHSQAVTESER